MLIESLKIYNTKYNRRIAIIIFSVFFYIYLYEPPKIDGTKVDTIKSLELISLKGEVTSVEAIKRGQQRIRVIDKITKKELIYDFPGSFPIEKYQIKAKDSISKDANSRIIVFHSYKEKGIYEKGFSYDFSQWLR